jgi:hypothetical protein
MGDVMQTIQLQIPDDVITEYGRDNLTEQLENFIRENTLKKLIVKLSKMINMPVEEYQKILEQIRQEAWDKYKEGLL